MPPGITLTPTETPLKIINLTGRARDVLVRTIEKLNRAGFAFSDAGTEFETWEISLQNPSSGAFQKLVKIERKGIEIAPGKYGIQLSITAKRDRFTETGNKAQIWRTLGSVDPSIAPSQLTNLMLAAALYVRVRPALEAKAKEWSSYSKYLNDFATFANDIEELFTNYSIGDLSSLGTSHDDILERAFGETPQESLWNIVSEIDNKLKAFKKETAAMPTPDRESTTQRLLKAAQKGAVTGAIGATNRKAVDMLINSLGPDAPDWVKSQLTKKALEGGIPFLIMQAFAFDTQDRIPKAIKDKAAPVLEAAWDDWARDSGSKVMDEVFKVLGPLIQEYLSHADSLAALADQQEANMEDALEIHQKQRARVEEKVL